MIRPGSFNGIYAFKPTWGAISREGVTQYSMTCDTVGLYARSVTDLELLSTVFQLCDDEPLPSTPFSISGARIAFVKTHVWPKAGPGLQDAWVKAKELLVAKGAQVEDIELPDEFAKISKWHADVRAGEGRTSFLGSEFIRLLLFPDLGP
jgi:Asp-tRNA(Asn)/Glu-tRNA(Gln) amidotransferase A subunit family amidase